MNMFEIENEKPVIIIEEKPDVIPGQGRGEVPLIVVERDQKEPEETIAPAKTVRRLPWIIGSAVLTFIICIVLLAVWHHYRSYADLGVPVSVASNENISKLQITDAEPVTPEVVKTSDSILGVGMNFYELRGLRAEISMTEPDTTDVSVYLYSRCSDYHPDFSIIGSIVIDGQELASVDEGNRLGYFAGVGSNFVIGIARDEEVKEYVKTQGGCFFRQFVLLSSGVLPTQFYLHGKVERRGMGRMPNGKLYYIETLHKETMWDFADALREYGFVDAIYITGGYDYCFYRSADGSMHHISNPQFYPHKHEGQVPWLIFRKQ